MIKIISLSNQTVIADRCEIANSFFKLFKGLMGKKQFNEGEGLLLTPCREIHMWWMKIPIDVLFLRQIPSQNDHFSKSILPMYEITSCIENLRPWKWLPVGDRKARATLELPIGTIQRCQLKAGMRIQVIIQ